MGLVKVVWKVVTVIFNCDSTDSVTFHSVLYGFRAVCGTGTASPEAKLMQGLTAMRSEVLYAIFIGMHNVYDAFGRDRCLEILEGCGVVPQCHHILCEYLGIIQMVACVGDTMGQRLKVSAG